MTNFTDQQMQQLMEQADGILGNISAGTPVRTILAQIYVENLEDKTMQQGYVMADAIMEAVKDFDAGYMAAQENLDGFIRKFQKQVESDLTGVERCNYWLRFSAALTAASQAMENGSADTGAILREIENLSVSEAEADEALAHQLREQACEILKNSGILLTGLFTNTQQLEQLTDAHEAASLLIDLGNEEIEYRAIVAMLAYTRVKTGELENIPVDMNAAQITHLVCTQVEQARILRGVGDGSIAMELAQLLLNVLGALVLIKVYFSAAGAAFGLLDMLFGGFLYLPAMVMTLFALGHLFTMAYELWEKDSALIIRVNACAVRAIVKGAKNLAEFIREKVLPFIGNLFEEVKNLVRGRLVPEGETLEEAEITAQEKWLPAAY